MKVPWGWLPFTGTVCALCGMLTTMMTQDIWSAHTSMTGREIVEQMAVQVQGDFEKANNSFVEMKATCQEVKQLLATLKSPPPPPPQHWWKR